MSVNLRKFNSLFNTCGFYMTISKANIVLHRLLLSIRREKSSKEEKLIMTIFFFKLSIVTDLNFFSQCFSQKTRVQ